MITPITDKVQAAFSVVIEGLALVGGNGKPFSAFIPRILEVQRKWLKR